MGWELHAIATSAGHRSTESTQAEKLNRGMQQIHSWRVDMLTCADHVPEAVAQ